MQTVDNPREKYSNLIFLAVNALFLVAIFWMLPVLGGDHNGAAARAARQGHSVSTTGLHVEVKPATFYTVLAQFLKPNRPQRPY